MKGTRTVVIRLGAIGRSPMLDLGLVVIAAIAFLDWWTGVEVNPEIFYVIPVALAAWFSGRDLAMALSGVSALGWLLADRLGGHGWGIALWSAVGGLAALLALALALAAVRNRFKIEVTFETLKHLIGGFAYHFWTGAWRDEDGRSLSLEQLKDMPERAQRLIAEAMNAIEAFVNIALIATGLLQLLAIDCTEEIRKRHRWWLRTYSSEVPSEEMAKTVLQHEYYHHFRDFKHTAIYRIIRGKAVQRPADPVRLAA